MSAELIAGHGQAWHDERRQGLGSSDVAAALGLSTYARPIDVWEQKRGLVEPRGDTVFLEWGRRLEPVIAQAAEDATGIRWTSWLGAIRCKRWPIAFTHLDRRGRDLDGAMAALEAKSGMQTRGWGDPGTYSIAEAHLIIPPGYAIQAAHHLLCTDYARVYVAALIGYRDFRLYRLERDEGFLDDLLADERAWWDLHITQGVAPDPDGSEAYRDHLRRRMGPITDAEPSATPEQQAIAQRLLEARRATKANEQLVELERQRLDRSMGDARRVIGPGWKATRTDGRVTTRWGEVMRAARTAGVDVDVLAPFVERHTSTGAGSLLVTEEE